ncbi:MAG: response regulator [Xanthobacteraceae bacterium]|nr:response regulator [Xanthobacteraceae bacterium]MBV9631994.1 response regulator [Xanthobacteraceae bacterium]
MSVNRFIFLMLMMLYLWVRPVPQQQWALVTMVSGLVLTIGLFAHILWRPGVNPVRRAIAFCADLSTISLMIYFTGDAGPIFYFLLLWTVLGNGFRFGIAWLAGSGVAALVLFLGVVFVTPFWRANPHLAVGMAVGLVIIPGYAAILVRRLNDARRIAEHANAAKTMFLATVSHQLRTPLNAIRGAQDALVGSPLTPDQREMIGIARAGADILLSNIEELIDFAQIESGHLRANPVTFELLPLLGEVINIGRTLAHEKPLRFALHVDARCPLRLHGERRYLREILQNLLSNAVKFTQQGGVLIAVRPLEITDANCRIECEVIDTGIGIAAEKLEDIFDSFTQANERILDEFGGTGLGLAICRRLATALSGSIGVTSLLGEGSRFRVDARFELPPTQSKPEMRDEPQRCRVLDRSDNGSFAARLKRTASDQARTMEFVAEARADAPALAILSSPDALRARPSDQGSNIYYGSLPIIANGEPPLRDLRWHCASRLELDFTPQDWASALAIAQFPLHGSAGQGAVVIPFRAQRRGIRILVADDNKLNQRVVGKMLETAGFDTVFANNGDDALEVMDSSTIAAVLMDVNMPVLNGLDATKHYRFAALDLPHLPIIGMSADATERMQQRCLEAGMDACVTKPIDAQRLLATIEQLIANPSADPALTTREPASVATLTRIGGREASLDEERLRELEALGGTGFLREMLSTLMAEVDTLTSDLQRAQGQNDLFLFRDVAHSIRSCAVNLGAEPLARQAARLERLPAEIFARQGAADLHALVEQAARLRHDIGRRLAH